VSGRVFGRLDPRSAHTETRRHQWAEVFGDGPAPLEGGGPFYADLPIGMRLVYALDVEALDDATIGRLARMEALRDGCSPEVAEAIIREEGMATPAAGVVIDAGAGD
jgi:hypothetical protein